MPLENAIIDIFSLSYEEIVGQTVVSILGKVTSLEKG